MEDNISTFSPLKPLTDAERQVITKVLAAYRKSGAVPCTACRYCSPCPIGVNIPRNLALLNLVRGGLSIFHAKLVYDEMSEAELNLVAVTNRIAVIMRMFGITLFSCPDKLGVDPLPLQLHPAFAYRIGNMPVVILVFHFRRKTEFQMSYKYLAMLIRHVP